MVTPFGRNLVFVISQPRSGSTLLQRILAMSPLVTTASEPWVALKIIKAYIANEPLRNEPWDGELARAALEDFASTETKQDAVRAFLTTFYNSRLTGPIFVDKTPRYYEIVPELAGLFPQAKIILLYRNPLAVLASIIETWSGCDISGFNRDLYEAPKRLLEASRLPNTYCIHYENMVSDADSVKNLFRWLKVPFDPAYLNYGDKPGFTGSMGDKKVNSYTAPVATRADDWVQTFRDPKHLAVAVDYLSKMDPDVLAALGYPKEQLELAIKIA